MNPPSAFGTFRVLHQIGSGVLGPVFRSYDSHREQLVAVKAFRLDIVPEQAPPFMDALRAIVVRPVNDPAVVRPVDAGLAGATPFLVLEYISGDALDVTLRNAGTLTPEAALSILGALARAIDEAWDIGVGHGALHPRDVFLVGRGEIAVTGFGVAQALQSIGLRAPLRRPYTAPERLAGAEWNSRADIYSLGAIAQEALAAAGVPVTAELSAVLDRAMAEEPAERFQRAKDLLAGLAGALTVNRQPTALGTAAPSIERHPVELGETETAPDPIAEVPLRPIHEIEPPPQEDRLSRPAFPWMATAAVALAGLAAGGVAGFRLGFSRGSDAAIERAISDAVAQAQTQAPAPEPIAAAPEAPPARTTEEDRDAKTLPNRSSRQSEQAPVISLGSLQVDSRPRGARVTVDGRSLGQTPLRVPALSQGSHRVLIELMGHRRVSSTVNVVPGAQSRLAVTLEQTDFSRPVGRPKSSASELREASPSERRGAMGPRK